MGGKIAPIHKETQAEEAVSQENKTCCNNDKRKNITVNGNLKWFVQGKINNKQK